MTGLRDLLPAQAEGEQASAGSDDLIAVPSGQPVTLQEVIWNAPGPQGLTLRFRFLAPEIRAGGTVDFDTAMADMLHLCQTFALPRLADFGPAPAQVIISMADVALPFGDAAPEATQFFEAYSVQDGTCVWEIY
jgi:hypothetical protein